MPTWIKNLSELESTENRKIALQIANAGLEAIETEEVVRSSVILKGETLSVQGKDFDLSKFKKIKVVGFGKSSCDAALALEGILGSRITAGAVVGISKVSCERIEIFVGTHPRPSEKNVAGSQKIYETIKNSTEEDLIIVLVSGGGSALLSYPETEWKLGQRFYDSFLQSGKTIVELNTVRKHLSLLKGGGLAKIAYPATVIGLVFSDVPGDNFENVASGPTYADKTTVDDAQKIIQDNNLGEFDLIETPKDKKYFEKVHNFVLVSNKIAVEAMAKKGRELGMSASIFSTDLYDSVDGVINKLFSVSSPNSVVLAAGEPSLVVPKDAGKGGRNLHLGLEAIRNKMIDENKVFISLASDGMDNSDVAGAVVDKETIAKADELKLGVDDYSNRFDSYTFFEQTGDLIDTGPTGANVSDLMILLNKK